MPNSSDVDLDEARWGITVGLTKAANATDPASASKDAGYTTGDALDPGADNNRFVAIYLLFVLLFSDLLPQFHPWNGVMPGSPTPVLTQAPGSRST